jgi:hypothetical protein
VKFIDQVPQSKDKDTCDDASNGDVTFFRKTCLGFEFNFWFDRLGPSLVEIRESIVFPHTLLEVCPAHKTR